MLTHINDLAPRILAGESFLLAAEEEILLALPKGNWIGGTIPYFMAPDGGTISRDAIFATALPSEIASSQIVVHDAASLAGICTEAPENGFTFLILPATSEVHLSYSKNAPDYDGMFMKPLLGWVSGVHLDDLGTKSPKVVDGRTLVAYADKAVALHATLPDALRAQIGIVNLFHQGTGPEIKFPIDSFSVETCTVDGVETNLARWIDENKIDTRLPLVADYSGSMVNVSFQAVDAGKGTTTFYAPVFRGVSYRIAAPVEDYVTSFDAVLPKNLQTTFSCNCILNFLYSSLEGKTTQGMVGPVTFGEIAYQLLNQTLVYLTIDPA